MEKERPRAGVGPENSEQKTDRKKRREKVSFGDDFGPIWAPILEPLGDQNDSKKQTEKQVEKKRARGKSDRVQRGTTRWVGGSGGGPKLKLAGADWGVGSRTPIIASNGAAD